MWGSKIYSDFNPEIAWIRREVARDVQSLDPKVQTLARFYTGVRLKILQGRGVIWVTDRRMGRLIPYVAFWLADALGLTDNRLRRLSGLSLVCNMISVALRDDIADSEPANNSGKERLAQFWSRRYTETLRGIFPAEQEFTKVTSSAEAECTRYERWQSIPLAAPPRRPFSAGFLRESSRGPVACILPALFAIAHAAGRKEEVPQIGKFLWEFSMGWRIFDDLMDWEADLAARDMNRSSVLLYVRGRMGHTNGLDRTDVLSWFLSDGFVGDAYGAMIGYFLKARRTVASFDNFYLNEFMDEQIGFQKDKMASVLGLARLTLSDLGENLTSVLGPAGSRT
jgi:hypothetical protein